MKPRQYKLTAVVPIFIFALFCISNFSLESAHAQGLDRWLGPTTWWDWSDYRFIAKYRVMFPKLLSGTVSRKVAGVEVEHELVSDYKFQTSPGPFSEGWFQLQVDRLGLRLVVEEDRSFRGLHRPRNGQWFELSEVDISSSRLGLDLDIFRYPQFRAGINFDYHLNGVAFNDFMYATSEASFEGTRDINSGEPITIGLQATAIPGRIKEVPVIVNARIRFAMPFMKEVFGYTYTTNLTDWEVSAGLRPSVWETSAYKFASFSLGVEGGYRSTSVDAEFTNSVSVKYKFGGPFIQVGLYY